MPRVALGVLVAVALLGGCYSWTLGTSSADAGSESPAPPMDGGSMDSSEPRDSSAPMDSAKAMDTAPPPPDCAGLLAQVETEMYAAEMCTTGECTSSVVDQCGCKVNVAQPGSAATMSYAHAITAFKNSCTPSCGTCPDAGSVSFCLAGALPDGALASLCDPP
jgi:hypothetical protein